MRPTAIGAAIAAGGFAALAIQQGLASRDAYSRADALVVGNVFQSTTDQARYHDLVSDGDAARRNAYLSAGAAAAFAAAAGVLGWKSFQRGPAPEAVALRF